MSQQVVEHLRSPPAAFLESALLHAYIVFPFLSFFRLGQDLIVFISMIPSLLTPFGGQAHPKDLSALYRRIWGLYIAVVDIDLGWRRWRK